MLTMGEPIQLKTTKPMGTLGDDFSERIYGNYGMLGTAYTSPSEMLHFLSAPPEMYVEEGGMAPLVNHISATNNQNITMELINNVLNRILVSDTYDMTYQDRVFVENILKKIGITDVKEFMRQVQLVQQDTKNTKELITLYQSGDEIFHKIREYRVEEERKKSPGGTSDSVEEETNIYWLQQEVLNRLQTENIYQEVSKIVSNTYGTSPRISRQEMQLSEQTINADHMTVNRMRNQTFLQQQNLVYNRINTYEAGDSEFAEETYEQTVSNLVSAVLLNAIQQIYHARYQDLTTHASSWKWLTDALHVNAENTFQRFESYHNRMNLTKQEKNEYYETLQNFENREIAVLKQLVENKEEVQISAPQITNLEENNLRYRIEENLTEEKEYIENTLNEVVEKQEEDHKHVFKISEKKKEEEILKQLELVNQQNIERIEKLRTYEKEKQPAQVGKINRAKAMEDGLRALENPEEVVMEYLQTTTNQMETERIDRERLTEIMGEDTIRIFETLKDYQEHPEQHPNITSSEGQAMSYLMRDISQGQEAREELNRMEQEQLIHTHVQEESSKEVQKILKETVRYQRENSPLSRKHTETVRQQVELFHKQNETAISEEILEELENRNQRTTQSEIRTNVEQVQEKNQVTQIVTNKVNELRVEQDQQIERMVSQNVKQQLDHLSKEVFNKLERRMDSERRRRGI